MSENMVERVARAIFDSLQGDVHTGGWDFGTGDMNVSAETKERYRSMARAAIEAMRDPPSAVWIAMMNTLDDGNGDLHYRKWQAGIDAALKP